MAKLVIIVFVFHHAPIPFQELIWARCLSLFLFSLSLSRTSCLRSAAGWLVDAPLEAVEDRHVV